MVGEFIGKPLLDYLNERNKIKFTGIKVVNDTIASLFAGLTDNSYDAYIGLIVGTGTNMATFIPADKIEKLDQSCNAHGLIPVNLESGNFHPPFLTAIDDTVDAISGNPGKQRFEKAVSGMYLGDMHENSLSAGRVRREIRREADFHYGLPGHLQGCICTGSTMDLWQIRTIGCRLTYGAYHVTEIL